MDAFAARPWAPAVLIAGCVAMLPLRLGVETLVAMLTLIGLALIWSRGPAWWARDPAARRFGLWFLALWLPMCTALPDAVDPTNAWRVTLGFARLYWAGLAVIFFFAQVHTRERFQRLVAVVVGFWIVDALIQAAFGRDLFGLEYPEFRLNGIFGDNLKLGIVLAAWSPIALLVAHARGWGALRLTALVAVTVVVFLSNGRTAWLLFGVVVLGYLVWQWRSGGRRPWRQGLMAVVFLAALVTAGYHFSERIAWRIDQTVALLGGDSGSVSHALSNRPVIWSVASRIVAAHPINGVGPRGFRTAYLDHAEPDDRFVELYKGTQGAHHPHMQWLEVLTETGLIGLAGLLLALFWLLRAWLKASAARRAQSLPYALAVLAAFFPLNSTLALYSAFWSQNVLLIVALYFAVIAREDANAVRS